MKTTLRALFAVLASFASALAASGAETDSSGFLVNLFLAFGALIIVFQLIPGLLLFCSMIRELFSRPADKATPGSSRGER